MEKQAANYIVTEWSAQTFMEALVSRPSSLPGKLDKVKEGRGKLFC